MVNCEWWGVLMRVTKTLMCCSVLKTKRKDTRLFAFGVVRLKQVMPFLVLNRKKAECCFLITISSRTDYRHIPPYSATLSLCCNQRERKINSPHRPRQQDSWNYTKWLRLADSLRTAGRQKGSPAVLFNGQLAVGSWSRLAARAVGNLSSSPLSALIKPSKHLAIQLFNHSTIYHV